MRTTPQPIRLSTVTTAIRLAPSYRCDMMYSDCRVHVFTAYVDSEEDALCPACGRQGERVVA